MTNWEINAKIEELIKANVREIPWKGIEYDKEGLKQGIIDFIKALSFTDLTKIHEMV